MMLPATKVWSTPATHFPESEHTRPHIRSPGSNVAHANASDIPTGTHIDISVSAL